MIGHIGHSIKTKKLTCMKYAAVAATGCNIIIPNTGLLLLHLCCKIRNRKPAGVCAKKNSASLITKYYFFIDALIEHSYELML